MNGAWRSRIIALWHWFTESGLGFVFVPLVGFQILVLGMPLRIAVFLLVAVPFALWATSNRRAPKEIADKPFSFCLPGYRESLRRNISVGASYAGLGLVPFGLLFCWIDTSHQHTLSAAGFALHAISAFFVGVAGYLCISVDFRFVLSRLAWNLLLLLSIPLFMIAIGTFVALIAYPALGIPAGLAVCAFMWIRLGDMTCVRRGHRMIVEECWIGGHRPV